MPIYSRRSIRKYSSKEVSLEIMDEILDAGRVAPLLRIDNHGNISYLVVKRKKSF